jgi:uncharacterized protein YbjQ (UPF0145 family)
MGVLRAAAVLSVALVMGGCATWSTSNVSPSGDGTQASVSGPRKPASQIVITENDITNRKYRSLGDIDVTVNKTTIFNEDPTRAHVDEQLREKAAAMGADAVVMVRYGTAGVGFMSWGSIDGKGRAVQFTK